MLKSLIAASCLLATCHALLGMPPTSMTGGAMSMRGKMNFNPALLRWAGGRYSLDVTGMNIEKICNAAFNQMGRKVNDHLSDVMSRAVKYMLKSGQTVNTLGNVGANSAKWQCLINDATRGGLDPGNAANGVSDYFDTAAELRFPPLIEFNPCEMVFCGERGMTPYAMMTEMMSRLNRGVNLGALGNRVFGTTLAQQLNRRPLRGFGATPVQNNRSPMASLFGSRAGLGGIFNQGARQPAASLGASGTSAGQPGTANSNNNNMGQPGAAYNNNNNNNFGQPGAPNNNMGQPGAPNNNMGQPGASLSGVGSAGMPTNPFQMVMANLAKNGGPAGMMNMNSHPLMQMAASMMGNGNKNPTTGSGTGTGSGSGSGSGGGNMWQNMMSMMANRFNPGAAFNSQPSLSNAQAYANAAAGAGTPGAGTFSKIMNAMSMMAAMERMQEGPEHGPRAGSPFGMGSMGAMGPMGGMGSMGSMGGMGPMTPNFSQMLSSIGRMGGPQNTGMPGAGNTGNGGGGMGAGMFGNVLKMLG